MSAQVCDKPSAARAPLSSAQGVAPGMRNESTTDRTARACMRGMYTRGVYMQAMVTMASARTATAVQMCPGKLHA